MAKQKVYAIRKGKQTGIFHSWTECKLLVDGYPGAEYKSFLTLEEAEQYLGIKKEIPSEEIKQNHLIAYVDGSFEASIGTYSFGCVLLTPEGECVEKMGNGNQPESAAIRNVAGEMLGAMYAVRWAMKKGYKEIEIRYDYEGIEKWACGIWRAKMDLTQKYAEYMRKCSQYIRISYTKVAAHTGDYYNEMADQIAKKALTEGNGIPEV